MKIEIKLWDLALFAVVFIAFYLSATFVERAQHNKDISEIQNAIRAVTPDPAITPIPFCVENGIPVITPTVTPAPTGGIIPLRAVRKDSIYD